MMKRLLTLVSLLLVVAITATAQPKYIFLFIGDGLGINHVYVMEIFNHFFHTFVKLTFKNPLFIKPFSVF